MKIEEILFNIWDDYWDDGYVPIGEIQKTYGYIEEYDDIGEEQKEKISKFIFDHLMKMPILQGVKVELSGEDIDFIGLTHEIREKLLRELSESELKFEGIPINFYSES